jgi:hypothetical protein
VNITAKYLAITLFTWIGAGIAAEVMFRALGDRPTLDLQGMYAPFEAGNYRLATNVDTEASWASGRLTVHTDSLGLRCDAERRFAVKPNDAIDVLLLGDSQGFGNGVSFEDSIAGAFAESAAKDGYRVANAGVGGHSAASQMQLAEWLRDRAGVKVANYVLLVTPAMSQSGGHLNRAKVGPDGRLYEESSGNLAVARLWVKTNLVVYARIRDALRNSGIGREPNKEVPFVFKFYESGPAENALRESFAAFISRFKEFAEKGGARLHIVYVPLTLEMEFDPLRGAAASRGLTIDRDAPLRACSAVAKQYNIPIESLRPVLESLHQEGKPLHLPGDFHYDRELSIACGQRAWAALKPAISLFKPNHLN